MVVEKTVLEFNDKGELVFIGGVCKAKDLQKVKRWE